MSILIERITEVDPLDPTGTMTKEYQIRITQASTMDAFKTLVNRGLNTWDEAPPELKEFADILIHGKALQDYYRSTFSSKK